MKGKVGKVIEEFKIGNTTIKFNDAYMYETEEEVEKALDRISNIWIDAYRNGRVNWEMLEKLGPFEMIEV
ncbi:hypothetical protein KQI38_07505 [Tissierella carlieri]|uniref:hypothetical protein n=1 Tax=Tissierella carlieri TaxID=689904 RepID=UPI001C105601|nr:hypothetical protein [Tissierella carlieri]MBU5311872.1 hypothetical protein [Tissierella carlieri]